MYALNAARPIRFFIVIGMMVSMLMPFAVQSAFAQSAGKTVVYPGSVSIQSGSCVDGVRTAATVSVPSDTPNDGVFYTITQPDAQGKFRVHAQVGDTFTMGNTSGTGWERTNDWNAYYDGTAPVPNCGNGPSLTTTSDDADNAGTDIGVFALPQDCGTIPYPAPTGSNVSSNIVFSNYTITQNGVVHTGGPISLSSPTEELTLGFNWASTGSVSSGQYFTFQGPLDTNGNKVFASATQYFPVLNSTGTAQAGCASVVNGDISVQFTEYVNPLNAVDGRISIDLVMASGSSEDTRTIEFTFDDDSTFTIEVPGTPAGEFAKRGWFERPDQGLVENLGSVGWQLHVPASSTGYTNLVLSDSAPQDGSWTFSCAGPNPTNVSLVALDSRGRTVALDFTENCNATSMTLTIPAVPAGVTLDFYFSADVTPGAEGPFYNIATAQADDMERVQLPYEVRRTVGSGMLDGDFAVAPIPPAINHAVCVDDVWVPASVTLPSSQEGVSYTMTPNPFPAEGGPLVVIATVAQGYTWGTGAEANGWVLDTTNNTMVYEADVTNEPCEVPTETPPVETPTPPTEEPCIPPTPEECVPPPGDDEDGTPEPCVTPTIPAWCLETPTPPTVTELPSTGTEGGNSANTILVASAVVALIVTAAGITIQRERS